LANEGDTTDSSSATGSSHLVLITALSLPISLNIIA